ncbi:MAG: MBOAT family protein [Magnetococcales bacterium]|nr:MBOAT family protein [Magnetococcales bacterium]
MIFHSIDFLIFLIIVFIVYWQLPSIGQKIFLLLAGYIFYGYVHPWFLILLLASTGTDYLAGMAITRFNHWKRAILFVSLSFNLGLLCVFKYFGFFTQNINWLLNVFDLPTVQYAIMVTLPVGISFYTFQSMSYTIDVYRGRIVSCRNPLHFALYTSFFPQMVAGPIERAQTLLTQLEGRRRFSPRQIQDGLFLIIWGFFKKLVIADNVASIVNNIFQLQSPPFFVLWVGAFAFTIQIYADFSGYTDIARGTARLLGIELTINFNHPFLAHSPPDFWRRWHISLSQWIRDYLYIPLGGSLCSPQRYFFNIMVTFFLCGLWHGASWSYILWGLYNGLLIIGHRLMRVLCTGIAWPWHMPLVIKRLFMFLFTMIGFLIFRETDVTHLMNYFSLSPLNDSFQDRQYALFLFVKVATYGLPLWLHPFFAQTIVPRFKEHRRQLLKSVIAVLLFTATLLLRSHVTVDFIYFQF